MGCDWWEVREHRFLILDFCAKRCIVAETAWRGMKRGSRSSPVRTRGRQATPHKARGRRASGESSQKLITRSLENTRKVQKIHVTSTISWKCNQNITTTNKVTFKKVDVYECIHVFGTKYLELERTKLWSTAPSFRGQNTSNYSRIFGTRVKWLVYRFRPDLETTSL